MVIARLKREFCESKCYHIMLRGNGKMNLFLDDSDFIFFRETLKKYKSETETEIFAYCIMTNHVHLLLRSDNENLPLFLKKVEIRFSNRFNAKYEHVGHVFQNRYRSECINDNAYFISALRYIIRNPQQAGICHWSDYPWSSAIDYLQNNKQNLTDLQFAYDIVGNQQAVLHLFDAPIDCRLAEPESQRRILSDAEAQKIINAAAEKCLISSNFNGISVNMDRFIQTVIGSGVTIRQMERITGIGRGKIQKSSRINPAINNNKEQK